MQISQPPLDYRKDFLVDLFAGSGGTSTGTVLALQTLGIDLWKFNFVAINHWNLALQTHSANHPWIHHIDSDLERVNPADVIRKRKIRLLTASPECTYFSRALGGKPVLNQSRASAKYVLKWIHTCDIEDIWIENVPEFQSWGPVHRKCTCGVGVNVPAKQHRNNCIFQKPIQNRKGEYFLRFITKIREAGYTVEWRVLNAANYGDATTRERLIIIARKNKSIKWPEPTHHENPKNQMFSKLEKWRTFDQIWNKKLKGRSIYEKKLSQNTLNRIWKGFLKTGGHAFLLGQHSGSEARLTNKPVPTLAAAGAVHLLEPFLIQGEHGGKIKSTRKPMPTLTSTDAWAVVQPYLIKYYGTSISAPIDKPLHTVAGNDHFAIIEPILIEIDDKTYRLDFLHRMLTHKERAAAMSFPKKYKFFGTSKQISKQIGNAVPVGLARNITMAMFQ